jgi:SAM-dependent methyltransferase
MNRLMISQVRLGRNDPCWCGSTKKYKHCHLDIDSTSGENQVTAAKRVYLRNWDRNASSMENQGGYLWMAKKLEPYKPKRIFDVGSGDGRGLATLWNTFKPDLIFSIDENWECLTASEGRLKKLGSPTRVVPRLKVQMQSEKHYLLNTKLNMLPRENGVFLVESDFLTDPELNNFLQEIPPFDAVTVWLIGTHLVRQNCLNIAPLQMKDNGEYRLKVQNRAYELADKILRPGGVLQIVDRGEEPSTQLLKDDTMNSHRDQASVTSLQVKEMDYMLYQEVETSNRVTMVATPGTSGVIRENPKLAILSVISTKPN